MSSSRSPRVKTLIDTARRNPQLALHLSAGLDEAARREFGEALAQPPSPPQSGTQTKPGLRKCTVELSPLSIQLHLFAKSVSRTG